MDIDSIFGSYEDVDYSAMDRDSSDYRKAQMMNKVERENENIKKEEPLTKALQEATHISDDLKARFIYLAELYLEDMQDNIFKNQFQLSDKYNDISADEWNDFLSDRIVSVYINKHKRTLLKTAAEDNLSNPFAKNKRDNLKLIENIQEQEKNDANKNVVIIRLPDIYD